MGTSPMRSACQGMIQKLSGIHSEHTAAYTIRMLRNAALQADQLSSTHHSVQDHGMHFHNVAAQC